MHHNNNNGSICTVCLPFIDWTGYFAYAFLLNRIHIVLFQPCFVFNMTQLLSSLFILCMFFLSTNMYICFNCWCSNWWTHWIGMYIETTSIVIMYINNFYRNEWKSLNDYSKTLHHIYDTPTIIILYILTKTIYKSNNKCW